MSIRFSSTTKRCGLILFGLALGYVALCADDDQLPTKPVTVVDTDSSPGDIPAPGYIAATASAPAPSLTPPPDAPAPSAPTAAPDAPTPPAPAPAPAPDPASAVPFVPVTVPAPEPAATDDAPPPSLKIHPAGKIHYDRAIRDSMGAISTRPAPDAAGDTPIFFAQVDAMRKSNDDINAADYLRHIVINGDILPQYRARAMLELADCLQAQNQTAEALCWLKIWMRLYPSRPETAAVAYRVGALYKSMGLPELARDSYYLSLAHSVNEGQVNNENDLKQYTRLTVGTLWAMAANEYESGQWDRAAELFARFQKEATTASALSLENAAFLQADACYQGHQTDQAIALYEDTLKKHPFNPLALQARLRLYHLDMMKKAPEKAGAELQALIWTVRTAWPQQEAYWKNRTAELLLAINKKDTTVLPPLVDGSLRLEKEGKSWQDSLNHYDTLVGYQAAKKAIMDSSEPASPTRKYASLDVTEQAELADVDRKLNLLLPPPPVTP